MSEQTVEPISLEDLTLYLAHNMDTKFDMMSICHCIFGLAYQELRRLPSGVAYEVYNNAEIPWMYELESRLIAAFSTTESSSSWKCTGADALRKMAEWGYFTPKKEAV